LHALGQAQMTGCGSLICTTIPAARKPTTVTPRDGAASLPGKHPLTQMMALLLPLCG
jgi:hypothetical protein